MYFKMYCQLQNQIWERASPSPSPTPTKSASHHFEFLLKFFCFVLERNIWELNWTNVIDVGITVEGPICKLMVQGSQKRYSLNFFPTYLANQIFWYCENSILKAFSYAEIWLCYLTGKNAIFFNRFWRQVECAEKCPLFAEFLFFSMSM